MNELITLTCPSCGARIKVNEGSNRFSCDYCGNEHLMAAAVAAAAQAAPQPAVLRPRQPVPGKVRIEQDEHGARIIQRWFSPSYFFMAFFSVIWMGFLLFWYSMALGGGMPLVFSLFPLLHVAVGLYVSYSTIAGFFNTTTLELTQDALTIRFDPFPWPGEKTIPRANVKQLFCKEHTTYSKKGRARHSYHLYAVTQDDLQVKLLSRVDDPNVAQFFEQQLENWLRIKDQPVEGEIR